MFGLVRYAPAWTGLPPEQEPAASSAVPAGQQAASGKMPLVSEAAASGAPRTGGWGSWTGLWRAGLSSTVAM